MENEKVYTGEDIFKFIIQDKFENEDIIVDDKGNEFIFNDGTFYNWYGKEIPVSYLNSTFHIYEGRTVPLSEAIQTDDIEIKLIAEEKSEIKERPFDNYYNVRALLEILCDQYPYNNDIASIIKNYKCYIKKNNLQKC